MSNNYRHLHTYLERSYLEKIIEYCDVDCIFDVGANTGGYAERLRSMGFDGHIISFEPIPVLCDGLRRKSEHNEFWHIEECALAEESGILEFHVMNNSKFSSLHEPDHSKVDIFNQLNDTREKIKVEVKKLESVFKHYQETLKFNHPMLKMDTQSADNRVIQGGLNIVREFCGIQSELSLISIYKNSTDYRISLSFLEQLGFTISGLFPPNRGHFPYLIDVDVLLINTKYIK